MNSLAIELGKCTAPMFMIYSLTPFLCVFVFYFCPVISSTKKYDVLQALGKVKTLK